MDNCKEFIFYHLETSNDASLNTAEDKYVKDNSTIR